MSEGGLAGWLRRVCVCVGVLMLAGRIEEVWYWWETILGTNDAGGFQHVQCRKKGKI